MSLVRVPGKANQSPFLACRKLLVPVLLLLLLPIPSVVQALSIDLSFTGTSFTPSGGSENNFIPPDTMGAAGPDHFVELLNGRYSVYRNADGGRVQTSTHNEFWQNAGVMPAGPAGRGAFDPRVAYDPSSGRWFAASVDNVPSPFASPNNFLVAVSNSSNPTQGWKGFAIPSDSTNARWADFPALGVNRDGVYVAANMLPISGGTVGTSILVLPKTDLIAGTVANRTLFERLSGTPQFPGPTLQPVTDLNGQLPAILLSGPVFPSLGLIQRSDIVGSITSPTLDTNTFIPVPLFARSPSAPQPGPKLPLETGVFANRLQSSVVMVNGLLWGVESVNKDGRSALRWFGIDAATNTLSRTGLIADPVLSFYYGSIAVNNFGDVLIGFSGSGPSQFVSAYAVDGHTTDGVTTFGDPVLLKAGVSDYEQTFGGARNRWGDYSATTLDPDDPYLFWTIQEWVSATDIWSTQIIAIDLEPVPEPTTFLLLGTTAAGLGLARWRQSRRKRQPEL